MKINIETEISFILENHKKHQKSMEFDSNLLCLMTFDFAKFPEIWFWQFFMPNFMH